MKLSGFSWMDQGGGKRRFSDMPEAILQLDSRGLRDRFSAMRKKIKKPLPMWRIVRIKATPAAEIGAVFAPDAQSAVREAIQKYHITEPWQQQRLMACRVS